MSRKFSKNQLRIVGATIALMLMVAALPAAAQFTPIVPAACRAGGSGCTLCHMGEMVINITNYLIYVIALPVTVVFIAAGGIILMISGTSEERHTLGIKILTSTLIGVIIVLIAWLAVDTIIKVLTGGADRLSQLGPWHEFNIPAAGCPL